MAVAIINRSIYNALKRLKNLNMHYAIGGTKSCKIWLPMIRGL